MNGLTDEQQKFLDSLNAMCEDVHKQVPLINYGGCAVFASALGLALESMGIKAWCVTWRAPWQRASATEKGYYPKRLAKRLNNVNSAREWVKNGWQFAHVTCRFAYAGRVYECDAGTGAVRRRLTYGNFLPLRGGFQPQAMAYIYEESLREDFWNSVYPIRYTPTVHKIVTMWADQFRR